MKKDDSPRHGDPQVKEDPLLALSLRKSHLLEISAGKFVAVAKKYSDDELFELYATAIKWGPEIIGDIKLDRYLVLIRDEITRRHNRTYVRWTMVASVMAGVAAVVGILNLFMHR